MQASMLMTLISQIIRILGDEAMKEFALFVFQWVRDEAKDGIFAKEADWILPICETGFVSLQHPQGQVPGVVLGHLITSILSEIGSLDIIDIIVSWIEEKAKSTDTKFDDLLLMPLCKTIRMAYNIPAKTK